MTRIKSNYISLKQAAEISGYAPDYIGQLIRQGKLPGRQVYKTVAWMTTEKALKKYIGSNKNNNNKKDLGFWEGLSVKFRRYRNNLSFEGEFKSIFKIFFYITLTLLIIIIFFIFYIFSVSLEKKLKTKATQNINIDYQYQSDALDTDLPAVP